MSLQMSPAGGGYSGSTESGIFIPRDLLAVDRSGHLVSLPERVGQAVLETTPETLARESVALPLHVLSDGTIQFLRGRGREGRADAEERLRFVLNRTMQFCYAPRAVVEELIDLAYLDGEIQNCERPLSSQCPRTFQRLDTTDDPRCRICRECDRAVRLDRSEAARRRRASAGLLIAEPPCDVPIEVLQEFASYSTGATPEDAAAWPQWDPPRQPRYEILERPEPFRQEGEGSGEAEGEPPAGE